MLTLLRRPLREADATSTFYVLTAVAAFAFAACFTLNLVFQYRVVGLDPFQMVLVGTVLEATCFVFEVPTGIVADLHSRRVSVIIGFFLVGVGFAVEGVVATFAAAIVGNVIWGIGYTFTSGALQAWITDEVGEEHVARVFTRETQLDLAFGFLGTLAAGGLGLIALRVPIVVAGVTLVLLAVGLAVAMPERHFHPTPRGDRETFGHLKDQFVAGLAVARGRRVVRVFLLVSVLVGLSSEVFDRLWQVRVLDTFAMPSFLGGDPAVAFTVFALIGSVVSLLASGASSRWLPARVVEENPGLPVALAAAAQVAAVVGVALLGNLWLVLAGAVAAQREQRLQRADPGDVAQPQPRVVVAGDGAVDEQPGQCDRPGRGRAAARRARDPDVDPRRAPRGGGRAAAVRAGLPPRPPLHHPVERAPCAGRVRRWAQRG